MDLLGKKGEEAWQDVEKLSEQLRDLESHLDAVDSALQDYMDRSQQLLQETYRFEEQEIEGLEEMMDEEKDDRQRLDRLERRFDRLEDSIEHLRTKQAENQKKIETIMDSELLDIVERVRKMINDTNRRYNRLRDGLESLEQRINEVENDLVLEINSREFDFDRKLDRSEHEQESDEIWNEIKKLRASVNVLAEELDKKGEIQVN